MVMSLPMLATLIALGVLLLVALAEWLHLRRIRRIAHLAFGTSGRPRRWTVIAPYARSIGAALCAWGLVVLLVQKAEVVERRPESEASKHLLVCLDASPSMYVEDAGPSRDQKRAVWAGEVIQAILDRIDTETTRVTVFAIYTDSMPVVEETFDLNVVRNLLDGLPLHAAFRPGPTNLGEGVTAAMEYARRWEPGTATLLVVSDGDSDGMARVRFVPAAIADTIVVGVGDPVRPTMIAGHRSTQDASTLKSIASQARGVYHQGNTKHLPSAVLDSLSMIQPRVSDVIGLREVAFIAVGIGGVMVLLIEPMLAWLGRRSDHIRPVAAPKSIRGARLSGRHA